jgi:hypothetical protein
MTAKEEVADAIAGFQPEGDDGQDARVNLAHATAVLDALQAAGYAVVELCMTAEPIQLTMHELDAAAAAVDVPGGMGFHGRQELVATVVRAINGRRAADATFRSLSADLKRLTEANLTYDDQARDLLGSYDITPKP